MYLGIDFGRTAGNGAIDWSKAKAAGCQYAFFRATFKTWTDPTWKREAGRAREAGMIVGAYLFPVMDVIAPPPEEQVAAFWKAVGPLGPGCFPPVLDVEFSSLGIAKTGRTQADLLAWIRTAVAALKKSYGVAPMIYTNARIWDGRDPDSLNIHELGVLVPEIPECPLWASHYPFPSNIKAVTAKATVDAIQPPLAPKAWLDPANVWIHQYQGDAREFPGCSGLVDLNRFFDLSRGARGERVRWLQRMLKISVDGDFGPITQRAVLDFQSAHQLAADGIVDPRTFARLCWTK
jgi:GH25 family lysozyme M1 (1,4-beta-N-acetylmuramidase)